MERYGKVSILGVNVSVLDTHELLNAVDQFIVSGRKRAVFASGNVQSLNIANKQKWFMDFLNGADIVRLDGAGVRLGITVLGHKCPPRSTWADFAWPLAELCSRKGYKLFLFGGQSGIADAAGTRLITHAPSLQIVGTEHGYIDITCGSSANRQLIERINQAGTEILIVGLGMPKQERWLLDNIAELDVRVIMTCGAAFEYIAGMKSRAPEWMRGIGLEWFFRLLQEPGRLWRRYLLGNAIFALRLARARLSQVNTRTDQ